MNRFRLSRAPLAQPRLTVILAAFLALADPLTMTSRQTLDCACRAIQNALRLRAAAWMFPT